MSNEERCRRFLVSGRVQGVFYRASTRERATALDLNGYACNLADGRVEVLACGERNSLDALEAWLWQGPSRAEVKHVDAEEVSDHGYHDSFVIS
jgi:acylphosphatase